MEYAAPRNHASSDEAKLRELIARWAKAVREEDMTGIRADHDPDMLMFDVPPPFLSRGLDAYMATWKTFLSWSEKPVALIFTTWRSLLGRTWLAARRGDPGACLTTAKCGRSILHDGGRNVWEFLRCPKTLFATGRYGSVPPSLRTWVMRPAWRRRQHQHFHSPHLDPSQSSAVD